MKKQLITIVLIISCVSISFGQGEVVKKYFTKFENDETFTKISVNSKMFSLFSDLENTSEEDIDDFLEAVSKLKGMKALVSEQVANPKSLYENAISDIEKEGYEELMTVQDAEENVKMVIKEKNNIIKELLIVVGGKEKFILLNIYGEIDIKTISKLAGSMSIRGVKYLKHLNNGENKNPHHRRKHQHKN